MNKEKSDRIRTKPSKFGWRIYDGSQKVQVTEVGVYVCPICKETSKLVQRQAPGFKNILSICQHGHTCEITKSLYEKYKVGDWSYVKKKYKLNTTNFLFLCNC